LSRGGASAEDSFPSKSSTAKAYGGHVCESGRPRRTSCLDGSFNVGVRRSWAFFFSQISSPLFNPPFSPDQVLSDGWKSPLGFVPGCPSDGLSLQQSFSYFLVLPSPPRTLIQRPFLLCPSLFFGELSSLSPNFFLAHPVEGRNLLVLFFLGRVDFFFFPCLFFPSLTRCA